MKHISDEDVAFIGVMARTFIKSMDVIDTIVQGVNTDDARMKAMALVKRLAEKEPVKPVEAEKKA